jgi:hypothetical protein
MSVFRKHSGGLRNVGSYQVAGTPYVSSSSIPNGSELRLDFPKVTNNITVQMDSGKVVKKAVKITGECRLLSDTSSPSTEFPDAQAQTYIMWVQMDPALGPDGTSDNGTRFIFYHSGGSTKRAVSIRYRYSDDRWYNQYFHADHSNQDAPNFLSTAPASVSTSPVRGASNEFPLFQIALTINGAHGGDVKFYLNSVLTHTQVLGDDIANWGDVIYSSASTSKGSNVTIVESGIFNAEFDQTQVNEAYNSGNYLDLRNHSKAANLKIYHTFGDNINDSVVSNDVLINDVVGDNLLVEESHVSLGESITETTATFNSGPNLRVHFNSPASDTYVTARKHYWNLDTQDDSLALNVKAKSLYLSSDGGTSNFTVTADLTSIPTGSMYKLTGSGIDE